jgi:tetratricopeptide (TPR) repeat protein
MGERGAQNARPRLGLSAGLLVAVTLATYWPVFRGGFVFDDEAIVLVNPCVRESDGLYGIWFTAENYDYLPITYTGFWAQYRLWGPEPLGYHVVSQVLHTANAILLWRLLCCLEIGGAWWGALLFAVHPLTASSVAWISEQKNLWGLLFALISLLFYLRFRADGGPRWYLLALASFVAALFGKTSVVMLPFIMLGYDSWRAGRPRANNLLRIAPFFLASLVLGLVTVWFQFHRGMAGETVPIGNPLERLATAGHVVWFYLAKAVLPIHLSLIYPRWDHADLSWWPTAAFAAVMVLLGWLGRHRPWAGAIFIGVGLFAILLVPVLGFVPMAFMRFAPVADHFVYPALPALTAVAGAAVAAAIARQRAIVVVAVAVAAVLIVLTARQSAIYQDEETLWRATIRANPDAWAAYGNLGKALRDRGNSAEATKCFAEAVRLKPDDFNLRLLLGNGLLTAGDLAGAAAQYEMATRIKPGDFRPQNNLAEVRLRQGKVDDALSHARAAIDLRPDAAEPHMNLAAALNALGRPAEAAEQAQAALAIDPNLAAAHFELGAARIALGDADGADAEFYKTLQLDPRHALAHNNLAGSLNRRGRPAEAAEHARAALAVEPSLSRAHFNLGNSFFLQGSFADAEREYREAIRLDPNFAEAKQNLRAVQNRR